MVAALSCSAATMLLGAPQSWSQLSQTEESAKLETLVLRSCMMVVSSGVRGVATGSGDPVYLRIDAIGSDSATTQVSSMLAAIGAVVNA